LRNRTIETGKRVDDRNEMEIRDLYCEIDLFERNHGSALFRRGETQVLTTTTLGGPRDYLLLDDMEHDGEKRRYFHHYNFPPFSVGEAQSIRFL
jgi:polyribonucleotide nucleotidyltransferase